jgi:hypothetical protein
MPAQHLLDPSYSSVSPGVRLPIHDVASIKLRLVLLEPGTGPLCRWNSCQSPLFSEWLLASNFFAAPHAYEMHNGIREYASQTPEGPDDREVSLVHALISFIFLRRKSFCRS